MFIDLLYCDDEINIVKFLEKDLPNKFPGIKTIREYDDIHQYRLSVENENPIDKYEYYKYLIQIGLLGISFSFSLMTTVPSLSDEEKDLLNRLMKFIKSRPIITENIWDENNKTEHLEFCSE